MINMRIALFERTKHKHEQRSFRFLAERHNALANGTLPKRFVGETTGHLVCHIAVFSVVTQRSSPQGGALRDDTKNGCVRLPVTGAREAFSLFPSSPARLCLLLFFLRFLLEYPAGASAE